MDAPYPPIPGPGDTRLLARGGFYIYLLMSLEVLPQHRTSRHLWDREPLFLITAAYLGGRVAFKHVGIYRLPYLPRTKLPGSGRLVGEEYRLREV
ncbi:MAG: hypothetical protein QXI84_07530 [Thermofilaceae archaeon]